MNFKETNILLAEYAGMGRVDSEEDIFYYVTDVHINFRFSVITDTDYCSPEELPFHLSWDWLMPVIDKIYSSDSYYEYKKEVSGQFEISIKINTKYIIETYKDVVKFLQWYYRNN